MSIESHRDLLQVKRQPFGFWIDQEIRQNSGLFAVALDNIQLLQERVTQLLESDDPVDQSVVSAIERYFENNDRPAYDECAPLERKIGEKGVLHWLKDASSQDFAALAQWNVQRNWDQMYAIGRDQQELRDLVLDKTKQLVNMGFFPTDAMRSVQNAIAQYSPIRALDAFEAGALNAHGYFDMSIISLANLYLSRKDLSGITPQLQKTAFHEWLHAAGKISGSGFLFHTTPFQGRAWEEGFVSHSVDVAFPEDAKDPQIDVLNPDNRTAVFSSSYKLERQVMAYLSSEHLSNIPISLWAHAYFDSHWYRMQEYLAEKVDKGLRRIDNPPYTLEAFNLAYESTWHPNNEVSRERLLSGVAKRALAYLGVTVRTLSENEQPLDEKIFAVVERS